MCSSGVVKQNKLYFTNFEVLSETEFNLCFQFDSGGCGAI